MDEKVWELAANLVPTTYVRQARDAAKTRQKLIEQLLDQVNFGPLFLTS